MTTTPFFKPLFSYYHCTVIMAASKSLSKIYNEFKSNQIQIKFILIPFFSHFNHFYIKTRFQFISHFKPICFHLKFLNGCFNKKFDKIKLNLYIYLNTKKHACVQIHKVRPHQNFQDFHDLKIFYRGFSLRYFDFAKL